MYNMNRVGWSKTLEINQTARENLEFNIQFHKFPIRN